MSVHRPTFLLASLAVLVTLCGCVAVPQTKYNALKEQNRALVEQNRALKSQFENLQVHCRNTEDQLMRTEEDLAMLEERLGLDQQQLANFRQERDQLHQQFAGMIHGAAAMTPDLRNRLTEISRRYPSLQFDPATGVSKLDTDVLFDTGNSELKPGAERLLQELVAVLNSDDAQELKIMVVGHTDDRKMAKRPARDKFPNNFHLSAGRALAVADQLRRFGLADQRMGVAGFGAHQPVAPNVSDKDRRKNRRVELFVMAPNVPVVGWTETTPNLY